MSNEMNTSLQRSEKPPCSVCGEVGNGIHFGAEACRACAAFFRRSVALNKGYRCRGNGKCDILSTIRCMCRSCRFGKCISVGMKREAVQKYRDAYGKRGSDVESPNTLGSVAVHSTPNSSMCILESVEEGGMPILNTLSANYAKLESVRRVVHHEQGASVFQTRIPKAVTYKEANEVSSKECDLVADWILNSYPGFSDLPKEQKKILFRNFFLPFVILQGGHFACIHNRNDVIILASGDYIDCSHPETFYYDPDGRQLMSSEDAVRMFASSFSNYRRNVTDPMLRDNVDSYEFFALCSLVLFDTGLEGQSEECIMVSRRIREAIQREILYYYRNVRHIDDPSMRLANLLSLLPALQSDNEKIMEDGDQLLNHSLASWLKDCVAGDPPLLAEQEWRSEGALSSPIHDNEIFNGYLLNSVMYYIESNEATLEQNFLKNRPMNKITIFEELLIRISSFYKENLKQLIVCRMPSLELLVLSDDKKSTFEEIKKLILLILGCAIQSEKKKIFVDRITRLGKNIQADLADYIQMLTDNKTILVRLNDASDDDSFLYRNGANISDASAITNQVDQDQSGFSSKKMCLSENGVSLAEEPLQTNTRSSSPDSECRFLTLQLANVSHENRQLRSQAENKDEECRRLEVELEEKGQRIALLENQRLLLLEKERVSKNLKDDLQAARCRIEKLQPLEKIEKKFREAEDEREFYKSKYEIVHTKNNALEDTISELDKRIKTLQIKNNDRDSVEENLMRVKSIVKTLECEIGKKNSEIEALMDDKHLLNCELKEREERILQLETCSTTITSQHVVSLADQLEDAKQDEFDIMAAEIRKLRAQTEGSIPTSPNQLILDNISELKKKLAVEELKSAEYLLNIQKLHVEREQIDGSNERFGIELKNTMNQLDLVRQERDEAIRNLHEARRKFSQFQAEFGKRFEEDSQIEIRGLRSELEELKHALKSSHENQSEVEFQLNRVKEENRKVLLELDEMIEEKSRMELDKSQINKEKRNVEIEREVLEERTGQMEDEIANLKLQLLNSVISKKKLNEKDLIIENLLSEKRELENELRIIQHQFEVESKKTQSLREDLVCVKSKGADLVSRLRSLCMNLNINGASIDIEGMDDEKLINNIDEIMMTALTAVKRESNSLRIQQNKQITELADLKKDIQKLRRSESESLCESDDRVRQLTTENINAKEQVYILQEKLRELNLLLSTKCDEVEMTKNLNEKLNKKLTDASTKNADIGRLQVTIRNSQTQENLVKKENSALRDELVVSQNKNNKISHSLEELENMHKALLADHSRLQHLHNSLTNDYDEVKKNATVMKLKLQTIPKQQATFLNSTIQGLESKLNEEMLKKEQQLHSYAILEKNYQVCQMNTDCLRQEVSDFGGIRDILKEDLHRANEKVLKLDNIIDEQNKQIIFKASEISKLANKVDGLSQLNQTYNEENKNLSRQLEILLTQNKELLQRALLDKDQYHLEMKDFQDQLSALRRHKEKLEDKIMDQYRTMENKRTPERKQPLVKRAAKALINRRRALSNGGSTTEDSSAYSADERCSPPLADDNDNLPITSSSCDDKSMFLDKEILSGIHSRRDHFGGLPPRTPVRNSLATSSLRSRPPPPPYTSKVHNAKSSSDHHEKIFPFELNQHRNSQIGNIAKSSGNECSTTIDGCIVDEGEQRVIVRDKEERVEKTLSYYENVNIPINSSDVSVKPNESTLWFEYGCV